MVSDPIQLGSKGASAALPHPHSRILGATSCSFHPTRDLASALHAEDIDEGRREEKKDKKEGRIRRGKRWKQNAKQNRKVGEESPKKSV